MRLAMTSLEPALTDEPVPLKRKEMCPNGVISQLQLFSKLIDCSRGRSQQVNDAATRAIKESFI
jgi:hypothetical protein